MSVIVISPGRDPEAWVQELKNQHPGMKIIAYPEEHAKEEVEYAVTWKHPRGIFKNYPNLKVIASMGAGVDHITSDPEIPENVTITRIIDDQLTIDMSAFVLALVMNHLRDLSFHHNHTSWEQTDYLRIEDQHIGVMGVGVLGSAVVKTLTNVGFEVSGWATQPKPDAAITIYGEDQLDEFLSQTNILVCLLPLTQQTENILNKELFQKLPKGAYIINVARGQHLVEHDLIEMVDTGHLSGASLDVFRKEPLPAEHPFWKNPKIRISPHIASVTDPRSVVPQLVQNYVRMTEGKPLKNIVKRQKGY
jgi:glyoxylate/hydroxypyruvate reductase A